MPNLNRKHTLIFLHIPKAAGNTLHHIIDRQYDRSAIFHVNGSQIQASKRAWLNLSKTQKENIRVLKGHMEFGWHVSLPGPYCYITILRNPVDRVISHYYYVLRRPSHYLYPLVVGEKMSLQDYVCTGISTELDNGQTRLLSGMDEFVQAPFARSKIGYGQCTPEMLEQAKENLVKHFAVVGLTEQFDETLMLLKRAFGWCNVIYTKRNVSKKRSSQEQIPPDTLRAIEAYNKLDAELYRYAAELHEELLHQQSFSFKAELASFKAVNSLYQKVLSLRQAASRLYHGRYSRISLP